MLHIHQLQQICCLRVWQYQSTVTAFKPTQLLAAILRNSWHLPSLSIRYITGHGPLTFLTMCVSVCVCMWMCVWWVTWACPPDILLHANGIHCHGSWRGGGHCCLCVNGACRSPVGVCVCMSSGSTWFRWHREGVAVVCVCVCVCACECLWMFCLLTGECVFALCQCFVPFGCVGVRACVFVWAASGLLSSRARVSGGWGDKGTCFFPIRTPTSTSLSLFCSTSLLSILPPFPLPSVPVVTPLSLSLSLVVCLCHPFVCVLYSSVLRWHSCVGWNGDTDGQGPFQH